MKTRIVIYAENNIPISTLGDDPQEKVRAVWELLIAVIAINAKEIIRLESVEAWDDEADVEQGVAHEQDS